MNNFLYKIVKLRKLIVNLLKLFTDSFFLYLFYLDVFGSFS